MNTIKLKPGLKLANPNYPNIKYVYLVNETDKGWNTVTTDIYGATFNYEGVKEKDLFLDGGTTLYKPKRKKLG